MGILQRFKNWFSIEEASFSPIHFSQLSQEQLEKSLEAGKKIQSIFEKFTLEGKGLLEVLMNGHPYEAARHYPWQGGILDQRTDSRYFYHGHEDYEGEHGHFHTFCYFKRKLVHLIALGLDHEGRINKLYTFNRWAPGDHYYPADQVKTLLPQFRISKPFSFDVKIHAYVENLLTLFQPEIEYLLDERDSTFDRYRKANNGQEPYEDRNLEITSELKVNFNTQVQRIEQELELRKKESPESKQDQRSLKDKQDQGSLKNSQDQENLKNKHIQESLKSEQNQENENQNKELSSEIQNLLIPLEKRSANQIRQSYEAGVKLLAFQKELKEEGKSLLSLLGSKQVEYWKMYPWDEGVIDLKSKSQYFYHSHPQTSEHGHFHTFYRYHNNLVHLIGINLDNLGEPYELFTVNRWVTGDTYYPAKKVKPFLSQFRIHAKQPDPRIHRFLRDLFSVYRLEMGVLLEQRDIQFQQYRKEKGQEPYEDRELELTSSHPIRIDRDVQILEVEHHKRKKI